jgi:hypothetical protein
MRLCHVMYSKPSSLLFQVRISPKAYPPLNAIDKTHLGNLN